MKKTIPLLFAATAFAPLAQAQTAVAVYGLVDTGVTYVNRVAVAGGGTGSLWSVHPGAMQASRWGLRGTEDIGGGNHVFFILEGGINLDTGTAAQGGALFGRRTVVGFRGNLGSVAFGRQSDVFDDIGSITSTYDFGSQVALIHGLDRTPVQRANNSVRVVTKPLGGLAFHAQLGLGENAGSFSAGSTRSLGFDYRNEGLRLMGGYHQTLAGAASADVGYGAIGAVPGATGVVGQPGDVVLRTWTLASAYQWGPARLHAAVSRYEQPLAVAGTARTLNSAANSETQILDVGLNYDLKNGLVLSASVIRDSVDFVNAGRGHITQTNLGMDYFLSKRTDVYLNAAYQTTKNMTAPGIESAPGLSRSQALTRVGIRHKF